jgi:hypothetical protein
MACHRKKLVKTNNPRKTVNFAVRVLVQASFFPYYFLHKKSIGIVGTEYVTMCFIVTGSET